MLLLKCSESKSQSTSSVSLYLLRHVGLRKVVKDERNLLLDIVWRLHDPLGLVSGHQQGVNVGCVYRGLRATLGHMTTIQPSRISSHYESDGAFTPNARGITSRAPRTRPCQ